MYRLPFSLQFLFLTLIWSCNSFLLMSSAPRLVVKILSVTNGAYWGAWRPPQFCAEGTYALGYRIKAEPKQGSGDDTSLNSILIDCAGLDAVRPGGKITSYEGSWGQWWGEVKCPRRNGAPTFLTQFALQVESDQGGGDDTAANFVKFKCRDFSASSYSSELALPPGHGLFGYMGSWSESCPANSAICGLRTKIEGNQGSGDDTSLDDVQFYCCKENPDAGK